MTNYLRMPVDVNEDHIRTAFADAPFINQFDIIPTRRVVGEDFYTVIPDARNPPDAQQLVDRTRQDDINQGQHGRFHLGDNQHDFHNLIFSPTVHQNGVIYNPVMTGLQRVELLENAREVRDGTYNGYNSLPADAVFHGDNLGPPPPPPPPVGWGPFFVRNARVVRGG